MKNKKMEPETVLFDEAISFIMDVSKTSTNKSFRNGIDEPKGKGFTSVPVTIKKDIKPKYPKRTVFINSSDDFNKKRIVDIDSEHLFIDPVKLFKNDYDFCIASNDFVKWFKYKTLNSLPKRYISRHNGNKLCFESHYRIYSKGEKFYNPNYYTFNGKDVELATYEMSELRAYGKKLKDEATLSFFIFLSMFDSFSDLWISEITLDERSIIIPSDKEAMSELALLRDEPLKNNGHRKAILHWVKKHTRKVPNRTIPISSHVRGVDNYNIGEFDVKVSPPMISLFDLKDIERFNGTLTYDMFCSLKENTNNAIGA